MKLDLSDYVNYNHDYNLQPTTTNRLHNNIIMMHVPTTSRNSQGQNQNDAQESITGETTSQPTKDKDRNRDTSTGAGAQIMCTSKWHKVREKKLWLDDDSSDDNSDSEQSVSSCAQTSTATSEQDPSMPPKRNYVKFPARLLPKQDDCDETERLARKRRCDEIIALSEKIVADAKRKANIRPLTWAKPSFNLESDSTISSNDPLQTDSHNISTAEKQQTP